MKKDCHTHPNVLKAPRQVEEFINRAVSLGFGEIHFTDHMPFSVTGDEVDRIPFGKVGDYCKNVRDLAEKHADKITIRCGIEIDYHPDYADEIQAVLSEGDFDVVLGSSHMHIKGFGYKPEILGIEKYAEIVLRNYLAAAKSGYFTTLTHLDYYRRFYAENYGYDSADDSFDGAALFEPLLRELFSEMEKRNITLEINAAPVGSEYDKSSLPYPHPGILALSREYNLKYAFGSDAHTVCRVGAGYDKVLSIIEPLNIKLS